MKPVSVCLPFSTTTTSAPAASSPSAPLLVGGSSPSNSWFTSPWMSEGRRSPSLLETVNLWLMVVAGETSDGSSCHGAGWRWRTKTVRNALASLVAVVHLHRLVSLPPSTLSGASNRFLSGNLIRCIMPTGPSHQPVSGGYRAPGS